MVIRRQCSLSSLECTLKSEHSPPNNFMEELLLIISQLDLEALLWPSRIWRESLVAEWSSLILPIQRKFTITKVNAIWKKQISPKYLSTSWLGKCLCKAPLNMSQAKSASFLHIKRRLDNFTKDWRDFAQTKAATFKIPLKLILSMHSKVVRRM